MPYKMNITAFLVITYYNMCIWYLTSQTTIYYYTIFISDMIEFNSPNYRVDEGETVEMTLTLKNPLPVELRVPFEYEYRGYGLLRRKSFLYD